MTSPVQLIDVTLRDGLQMESVNLPLEARLTLYDKLVACGYSRLEVTSFVNPKWVPQFQDADAFVGALASRAKAETMAFVPNVRGLERLLKHPIPWATTFIATSETFNKKNVNATVDETLKELGDLANRCRAEKRKIRIYVSTSFGCPYEGKIPANKVLALLKKVADLGPDEIAVSDTIGVAVPAQVEEVLSGFLKFYAKENVALHFHNTYGLGLACAQAGFDLGVRKFDGTTGGIGGCPYAKGATGNTATDELHYLFSRQGAMGEFPGKAISEALKYLATHVKVNSHLHDILAKGGQLYAVH